MPIDSTPLSINAAAIQTMGSIVIAALAVMWVVRKLIKTMKMKILSILMALIGLLIISNKIFAEEIPVDAFNCGMNNGGFYLDDDCSSVDMEIQAQFYPNEAEAQAASDSDGRNFVGSSWLHYVANINKFHAKGRTNATFDCPGSTMNHVTYYCFPYPVGVDCDGEPLYNPPLDDTDGDTITDDRDKCPDTEMNNPTGDYGCSVAQNSDGDVDYGTTLGIEECRETAALGMSEKLDPIKLYNGNNFQEETDLWLPSPMTGGFHFIRCYNSRSTENSSAGYGWNHNFNTRLIPNYRSDATQLKIIDETGKGVYFH